MPKTNNTLTPELRTSLLNSVSTLTDFLNNMECGCSYWVDFEGHSHTVDIGYVSEFLDDLEKYLKGEWEDPTEKIIKMKPKRYQIQLINKNREFEILYADEFLTTANTLELKNDDGYEVTFFKSDIASCKIIDLFINDIILVLKEVTL